MFGRRQKWFPHTFRSVRRQGIRDGRDWRWKLWAPRWPLREAKDPEPPATQQESALFESTLKEGGENDIQLIAERWAQLDVKLKSDYCAAQAELRQAQQIVPKEQNEYEADAAECKTAE